MNKKNNDKGGYLVPQKMNDELTKEITEHMDRLRTKIIKTFGLPGHLKHEERCQCGICAKLRHEGVIK